MSKVLITSRSFGSISDKAFNILTDAGFEIVRDQDSFDMDRFASEVVECEALVIGAHPFPKELMAKCKDLKIICKHGAGLDNIDIPAARELGIIVTNAPGTNSQAVADLTFGLMLMSARYLSKAERGVRVGHFERYIGQDVYGKDLGIMGFGNIGKNVARRAKGFNMKVLAYDPFITSVPEEFKDYVTLYSDPNEVMRNVDFLSLHLPLTNETKNMVDAKVMAEMRQGAVIINTSRGGVVNEKDLYDALVSGHLQAAGLDVTEEEPVSKDHPLLSLDQVIITPHIGQYSKEAIEAVGLIGANNIAAWKKGEELKFVCT